MKWIFSFKWILILLASMIVSSSACASENIFYVLRSMTPEIMSNLNEHNKLINIIISQAYHVDQQGKVSGSINPELINFAKIHSLKLMVMVTNTNFDDEKVHKFLLNSKAWQGTIKSIVNECQKNHVYGVQFDFEGIPLKDKTLFTHFSQLAATELHKNGFVVSFAVAPLVSHPQQSAFLKRSYEVWEGAYDVKALGKSSDFLTLMTYNQHTDGTTPGPTASFAWVEEAIKYALQSVPANKLSLGIATYSSFWYTGLRGNASDHRISVRMNEVSYKTVQELLNKNHAHLQWDATDKTNYAAYEHHWLREYIFVEDAKSFQTKLSLVKKYKLRGISVFRLGIEDPNIWKVF